MNKETWQHAPPWRPVDIPASKLPRSDNKLRQVLTELNVEESPRYKATDGQTWCNIYVWDLTRALGCEIPHWVLPNGSPAPMGKGRELNANGMVRWLATRGAQQGWVEADRKTAVDAAARGHVVVVGWDSGTSSPGHVALMLPEGTITQAGRTNFTGKTVAAGFGSLKVVYFIYAPGAHNAQAEPDRA